MFSKHIRERITRLGELEKSVILSQSNNPVYMLQVSARKLVLKMIKDKTTDFFLEKMIFERMGWREYLIAENDLLVYEYQEGISLLEKKPSSVDAAEVLDQFIGFISSIADLNSSGFGKLDLDLVGQDQDWQVFLEKYMHKQFSKGKNMPTCLTNKIKTALSRHLPAVLEAEAAVIPMDLNLGNFILDNKGRLKAINMPVVWRGDRLAPLGELAAHIYKTAYWEQFLIRAKKDNWDMQRVYFYMMLMACVILIFVSRYGNGNLKQARPWGNDKATFWEIIEFCNNQLNN